ncbi:MAG: GNAT family N-acetyltransferase [Syntrophobacteraceae bacterium]|nr:GNAT family N-acetyltransferase [Syntrophobacteraceae bacterium]
MALEQIMATPRGAARITREWRSLYEGRKKEARSALDVIRSGHRVFMGSGCGEPQRLAQALEERLHRLSDLEILHILSVGEPRFTEAGLDQCRLKSFFVASANREAVAEGRADYTPINLGDIPKLFRSGAMPLDIALIQVTPPDDHGFCSFGIAVDTAKAAAETARYVIAQVNPRMPRTLGDSYIHVSHIDAFVEHEEPLLEVKLPIRNKIAVDIGRHAAGLVEDGSTIRAGVGSISVAALFALEGKKDLGVHTDVLTDAYLHLVKKGAINNSRKTLHPGKIVASFCLGSRELYDFVDNNPMVALYPIDYTNDYAVIWENERMVTINSALEVDLSGQVCADSLGYEIYSGVGGTIDFVRGAKGSRFGKSIMVLPSTTFDSSRSRIVPALTEGAGVVTTRGGVEYIVTEYGVAALQGKSLRERALALISIAHPDFRDQLMEDARRINYVEKRSGSGSATRAIYPHECEHCEEFPRIGKVLFRPSKSIDERAVKEFFYSLPRTEAYLRFPMFLKSYPHYDVRAIVNTDYHRDMCILGFAGEKGSGRIVALAYYSLNDDMTTAELDFAVHPDCARSGAATAMVRHIAERAALRGIKTFVSYISVGNEQAYGVFQKLGFAVEKTVSSGAYEIRVRLDRPMASLAL